MFYKAFRLYGKAITHLDSRCRRPKSQNGKRLISLKNKYRGRRAFIIGNGPSLNRLNLCLLKNEVTIGCNGLFLIFDKMGFLPSVYTVEDRLVAEDRCRVINKIRGTIKIFPYDLRFLLKPDRNTVYINFKRHYPRFPQFSDKCETCVYWGGTVTFMNLQLAYYLGIREVYLIGMDHNYASPFAVDEKKGTVIRSHSDDVNHFHPDYFGKGYRYHDPMVERMEVGYKTAKKFYETNGGVIYNATEGGKLDVFPRVSYKELFSPMNKNIQDDLEF